MKLWIWNQCVFRREMPKFCVSAQHCIHFINYGILLAAKSSWNRLKFLHQIKLSYLSLSQSLLLCHSLGRPTLFAGFHLANGIFWLNKYANAYPEWFVVPFSSVRTKKPFQNQNRPTFPSKFTLLLSNFREELVESITANAHRAFNRFWRNSTAFFGCESVTRNFPFGKTT